MEDSMFVPIEEMMAATGFTKCQIFKDIRAELIRGCIHRRKAIVLRSDWNASAYMAGERQPRRSVGIVSIGKKSKAA